MSTSELLDQLAKLGRSEREKVWQRLEELELAEIEETPEMLAAIDAARASVREGKTHYPRGSTEAHRPMDYKVVLSDLTKRASPDVALRIGNELIDRALELGKNPFVGQKVRRRRGARKILRYAYRIYYDVNEAARIVEVLRVWHGARDPKTLRLS